MQSMTETRLAAVTPQSYVGAIKTFGEFGEPYQVIGVARTGTDTVMRICLVKTGEEADYSFLHMIDDPEAV